MKPPSHKPSLAPVRIKLFAAFSTGLLALVVAGLGIEAVDRCETAQALVDRAVRVGGHVRNLIQSVLETQVAQAAYLVVGDKALLDKARGLRSSADADLAALTELSDDPSQQERIKAIAPLIERAVADLEQMIRLADTGDRAAVLALMQKNQARFDFNHHEAALAAVRTAEDVLIAARTVITQDQVEATRVLLISCGGLAFVLATFVMIRIRKSVLEVENANATISAQGVELASRTRQLERTVKDLDQFAYVASHDLKAPLRGISNLAQWIQEDAGERLDDAGREHLRLMHVRVARMEALVDSVLAYARAGRTSQDLEVVDMAKLVREVIDMLAQSPGPKVTIETAMPTIHAIRVPVQQIWMNLISNAIKHGTSEAGEVKVGTTYENGEPVYYVADSGPGIELQFHDRIFGLYQTLSTRDKVESTGIGLAIVKKLVDQQGGHVGVTSSLGHGATFHFTYPSTPAPLPVPLPAIAPTVAERRARKSPGVARPGV